MMKNEFYDFDCNDIHYRKFVIDKRLDNGSENLETMVVKIADGG